MKKTNLILGIVIALILLGLSCSFSYFLGKKEVGENKEACSFIDLLSSRVINGLTTTASGEIASVGDRTLTLYRDGSTLAIPIQADALIYGLSVPEETASETAQPVERKEIKFEELKVGDKVNVSCKLKSDGTLEGTSVIVSS